MSIRRIGVVTGSRADYGLLYWVLKEIEHDSALELMLFVTGMHLAKRHGESWRQIEADGFAITTRVAMDLEADTADSVTRAVGEGVIGFAGALEVHRPDILVVLGDRFEVLAAAQAALLARIPLAHIAGGDTTEGAFDESIRHAITKMAHLHFPTNDLARRRIIQMGEAPEQVFNVGSPGIDYIQRMRFLEREALARELKVQFKSRNLLVTFHPATLEAISQEEQAKQLLDGLERLGPDVGLFFTAPNADVEGQSIRRVIEEFVEAHANARLFVSLGQVRYLSLMRVVDVVVGNSSSGLYEAPSLRKPAVNLGDRQRGRLAADSVIHSSLDPNAIVEAIQRALRLDCSHIQNPYGDGNAAARIVKELKRVAAPQALLQKRFYFTGDDGISRAVSTP